MSWKTCNPKKEVETEALPLYCTERYYNAAVVELLLHTYLVLHARWPLESLKACLNEMNGLDLKTLFILKMFARTDLR